MLLSLISAELSALALAALTVSVPPGPASCSLLLPACLASLSMTDACVLPLPDGSGPVRLALDPSMEKDVHLRGLTMTIFEYAPGPEAAVTPRGDVYLLHGSVPAEAALDSRGSIVLEVLRKSDNTRWGGGVMDAIRGDLGGINLQFPRPPGSSRAVLLIEGEASIRVRMALAGTMKEATDTADKTDPPPSAGREIADTITRDLSLHVFAWGGREWREFAVLPPWLFRRTVAVVLPLTGLPAGSLKIKLVLSPSYWSIDRVAADFSPEGPLAPRWTGPAGTDGKGVISSRQERAVAIPAPRRGRTRLGILTASGYYDPRTISWPTRVPQSP